MSTIMAADSAAGSFALCSTFLAAFVAALSTLTMGYGQGYPSTALRDLAELCGPRAFTIGSRESDLFAVSRMQWNTVLYGWIYIAIN